MPGKKKVTLVSLSENKGIAPWAISFMSEEVKNTLNPTNTLFSYNVDLPFPEDKKEQVSVLNAFFGREQFDRAALSDDKANWDTTRSGKNPPYRCQFHCEAKQLSTDLKGFFGCINAELVTSNGCSYLVEH